VFRESDTVDCDIANLIQESLEKQLQKQRQQLVTWQDINNLEAAKGGGSIKWFC